MSLNNVESSNGYLECVGTNGYAIGELQTTVDDIFSSVKNIEGKFEFVNISKNTSLSTQTINYLTSSSSSQGEVIFSNEITNTAWKAFDGVNGDSPWHVSPYTFPEYIGFHFTNGESHNVGEYKMSCQAYSGGPGRMPKDWKLQGSNDGTIWEDIDIRTGEDNWSTNEERSFICSLNNKNKYSYFRIYITANNGNVDYITVEELKLFEYSQISYTDTLISSELIVDGDILVLIKDDDSIHEMVANGVTGSGPYEMNTTAITGGEVPSRAYRVDEGVLFNNVGATGSGDTYELLNNIDSLNILNDGSCIALYNLDNDFVDVSGNYDGYVSGTSNWDEGKFNEAFLKTNGSDCMRVDGLPQMAAWTFTMWIYFTNSSPSNFPGMIGPVNGGNESLRSSHSGNHKILINDGSDHDTNINSELQENKWSFWSFSWDGSKFVVTLNDNEESYELSSTKVWDTTSLVFGIQTGNNEGFLGSMDQIRIFNKALSSTEINNVYNNDILNQLLSTRAFDDVEITGTSCETKVQMSATGNKMTELSFELWKES